MKGLPQGWGPFCPLMSKESRLLCGSSFPDLRPILVAMNEQQSRPRKHRLPLHAGIAAVVAILVFLVLFAAQSSTVNSASVIVALDEDQVSWPYHDAVRQIATGAIASSPDALDAANAAVASGTVDKLDAEMSDGQSFFKVTATGSDAEVAALGIDAAVDWAIEQNLAERQSPLEAERESLSQQIVELTAAYDEAVGADDQLSSARADETASLIAQSESRAVEIDEELSLILPQFKQVQPAAPDNNPLRPVFSAIAAFFAALAAFTLLEPSKS